MTRCHVDDSEGCCGARNAARIKWQGRCHLHVETLNCWVISEQSGASVVQTQCESQSPAQFRKGKEGHWLPPERPKEPLDGLKHGTFKIKQAADSRGELDCLPHHQAARATVPQLRIATTHQVISAVGVP